MSTRVNPTFDVDLEPDRSTFPPIQLRRFSGVQPAAPPTEAAVAELRAHVAAHRALRPEMPWPLPVPGSEEREAWERAMAAWVGEKDRLATELEKAEGLLRSAWRPCAPPAHVLNPIPSPAPTPSGAGAEPPRKARHHRAPAGSGPGPRTPAGAPRPGALKLTGSLQQGGIVPVSSASPAVQESLPSPDSHPEPEPPAETKPRRGPGRPTKNPDDPKSIRRRAQYRAAKEKARLRSGVLR